MTGAAALGGLFVVGWLVEQLKMLLVIILVSFFLSFALEPAVNRMERMGIRRGLGTGIMFLAILAALGLFLWAIGAVLADQIGVATAVSATGVVVGHNWSLFATVLTASIKGGKLRLIVRGGKGAATAFGAMIMIQPLQIFVAAIIGIAIVLRTRYVSLGVLIGFAVANIWLVLLVGAEFQKPILLLYAVALSVMLLVRHWGNVQRLAAGTERRFGESASG
jgi:glycerol-3-phosphate acyltransferase PlsY